MNLGDVWRYRFYNLPALGRCPHYQSRACFASVAFLVLLLFLTQAMLADVTIKQYFPSLDHYRFDNLEEVTLIEGQARIGSLEVPLLEEYGLLSYSSWHLRETATEGAPVVELQVHEMLDPSGAFGVFSLLNRSDPSGERLELPVENFYRGAQLSFWRGPYALQLRQRGGGPADPQLLRRIASNLVEAIPLLNVHPVTVLYLPQHDLIQKSISFYLGQSSLSLNPDFPTHLIPLVGFEDEVEVTYARYGPEDSALFLLGYPTPALAEDYFEKLHTLLQSHISSTGIYMKRSGLLVSLLIGPQEQARKILSNVTYTPSIKWIYEKRNRPTLRDDAITFMGMVRRVGLGGVCFIFLSLGGGALMGFFRHHLLERYLPWNGKGGIIRLNLNER